MKKSKNHNFSPRQKTTSHNNSYPSSASTSTMANALPPSPPSHLIRDATSSVTNAAVVIVHQLPLTLRSPRAIAINRWIVGKCDVNNNNIIMPSFVFYPLMHPRLLFILYPFSNTVTAADDGHGRVRRGNGCAGGGRG